MSFYRVVGASIALLFGLACGGGGDGSSPLGIVTLAAQKTQEAGTARVSMEMTMDAPTGPVTTTGEGIFDMDAGRGEMSMQMDLPKAPGSPGEMTVESVFDGTVMYMKMPALTQQLPGGKPWLSMDLAKIGNDMGFDMGALMQAGGDPTQSLQYLRGASGKVETVGEEEVRGAPATHYRANIVLDKIVDQAPEDLRDRLQPSIDLLKEWLGSDEMPVDVWIDSDGRMVRQQQSVEYKAGPAAGTSMDMTMEMYDFGTPVDVQIPPASQVTDFAELMEQVGPPAGSP